MCRVLTYFKTVMFMRFLLGLYYGFDYFKSIRFVTKAYVSGYVLTVLSGVVYSCVTGGVNGFKFVLAGILFMTVLVYFGLSVYTNERRLKIYRANIAIVDRLMRWKLSGQDARLTFFITASAITIKLTSECFLYGYRLISVSRLSYLFSFLTVYVSNIPNMIIFEMLFVRMRYLRKYLATMKISGDVNSSQINEELIIKRFLIIYKHLLNILGKTNKTLKATLMFGLATYFVKIIALLYFCIFMLLKSASAPFYPSRILEIVLSLSMFFTTILFAELVKSEYDKMKEELGDALSDCTDKRVREAIWTAIDYLESRPASYTIYRSFPLGITLVLSFIQITAQYIIVWLQFDY